MRERKKKAGRAALPATTSLSEQKKKKKKRNALAKADRSVLAQVFDEKYRRFLGSALLAFLGVLTLLVAAKRWAKARAARGAPPLPTPAAFFQSYGRTVLMVCLVGVLVAGGFVVGRGAMRRRAEEARRRKLREQAQRAEEERLRKKRPKVALEHVHYERSTHGIPWSDAEQFALETLLHELGVPSTTQEWDALAANIASTANMDDPSSALKTNTGETNAGVARTGSQCKARVKAIAKALEDQAAESARVEAEADEATTLAPSEGESKQDLLKWWLDVGLKKFDSRAAEAFVYNEALDSGGEATDDVGITSDHGTGRDENRERAVLEVDPARRGIEVAFEKVLMWRIGTARLDEVHCQIGCTKCGQTRDMELSGTWEDMRVRNEWCSKCKGMLSVALRPATLHENNNIACYMDCSPGVTVIDMLPSTLIAWCFACASEITMPTFQRGRRVEKNCPECHTKLAFSTKHITLSELDPERRKLARQQQQLQQQQRGKKKQSSGGGGGQMVRLVKGNPLPNMGACKHFKKSLRWLRFSCCGKLYACPVCHEEVGGCLGGSIANTMVCGKCSHEQPCGGSACVNCKFKMGKGKSNAHWQGGAGSRNTLTMSKKDRKKGGAPGSSKKTTSKKSSRVGLAGKRNREQKVARK